MIWRPFLRYHFPNVIYCYQNGPTKLPGKVWSIRMSSLHDVHFIAPYYRNWKIGCHEARTCGGCMTSNFTWQLSRSIWVTYITFGLLGWLEIWHLKNGLQITTFISVTYYINFGGPGAKSGEIKWPQIWYVDFWDIEKGFPFMYKSNFSKNGNWAGPTLDYLLAL